MRLTFCLAVGVLLVTSVSAQEQPVAKRTITYKQVDDLEIKLDAYVPQNDTADARPVAVWIHGGALINGHREAISRRVQDDMLELGCVVVSIDYRLAPETKLPEIIADVEDAFRWLREHGPDELGIDPDRLVVLGGSAGGYLTLVTGYRVEPRPKALVAFWGYGDLVGAWYSTPSPHPRHHQSKLDEAEAWRQVSGPPIADSRERKGNGGAFYQFCRQHGAWPKAVSGWDPVDDVERFVPYMPVRNVSPEYPPTLLIHGTDDTDVPYEQSTMMAEQFREHGVRHELITVDGGEHGLGGADADDVEAAYRRAKEFVQSALAK